MPSNRRTRVRRGVAAASLAAFAITWGVIAGTGSTGARSAAAASGSPPAASGAYSAPQADQPQASDLTTQQS